MMKFVAKGPEGSVEFALKDGVNLVGRDESCDIVINSTHVSRNHISCVVSRDRVVIQDLNSRNGTFVNGLRVKNSVEIKPGDVVSLGKYTMVFAEEGADGESVLPSMVVPDDEDAGIEEEAYRGETLPLKGDTGRRQGGENLPARYDGNRYAVTTRGDNKIVLSNGMTGEALELYRGGPDAMSLEHLIAERRSRQRRNMILAVGGGVVVVILILALLAMPQDDPRRRASTPSVDKEGYYTALDDAVAFYTEGRKDDAATKLAEAKKIAGKNTSYTLHVQLEKLFTISSKLDNDWENLTTAELAEGRRMFSEEVIDMANLPENFNVMKLRTWLTRKKAEILTFTSDKANYLAGEAVSRQIQDKRTVTRKEAMAALKVLRSVRAVGEYAQRRWKKYYAEEGWKAELTVSHWLVRDALGEDPDGLETDIENISEQRATDMIPRVSAVLVKAESMISDEDLHKRLVKYSDNCFTVLRISAEKQQAYEAALRIYENAKSYNDFLMAQEAIKDFRDEAENEVIKNLIKNIDMAIVVFEACEEAVKYYKAMNAEEALKILEKCSEEALKMPLNLNSRYNRLQSNIVAVYEKYQLALEAEKISDVLQVQAICEEISQMIDEDLRESNQYFKWALDRQVEIQRDFADDARRIQVVDNYIKQAEKYLAEENYAMAKEFAAKANQADPDGKAGKNLLYNITKRGEKMLDKAIALHEEGRVQEALEIVKRIIEEKIYNDGDGMLDSLRYYRDLWSDE